MSFPKTYIIMNFMMRMKNWLKRLIMLMMLLRKNLFS